MKTRKEYCQDCQDFAEVEDPSKCPKHSQPQHTSTPWKVFEGMNLMGPPYYVGQSEDGKHTPFQSTTKANAEYIVRAVNSHEELIRTNKILLNRLKTTMTYMDAKGEQPEYVAHLKEIIATVEGK